MGGVHQIFRSRGHHPFGYTGYCFFKRRKSLRLTQIGNQTINQFRGHVRHNVDGEVATNKGIAHIINVVIEVFLEICLIVQVFIDLATQEVRLLNRQVLLELS